MVVADVPELVDLDVVVLNVRCCVSACPLAGIKRSSRCSGSVKTRQRSPSSVERCSLWSY